MPIFICQVINPDLSHDATTTNELSGQKRYLEIHAVAHHYWKCCRSTKSCEYCSPLRCPPEVFQGLSLILFLVHCMTQLADIFNPLMMFVVKYQILRRTDHQQVYVECQDQENMIFF